MTAIGSELVHLSIKCRCSCTITYQCTSPSTQWSAHNLQSSPYSTVSTGSDQVVSNEIPVFCYSCGHRVTTLYRNTTPNTAVGPITRESMYHVTMDTHPQPQTNILLAAQSRSLVLPPQTPIPGPARNSAIVTSSSGLPKLDPIDDTVEFEEDLAQSPSARPGTIIPMY